MSEKKISINNLSLLETLTSAQIKDLTVEQELKMLGVTFYYAIDNHDIVKYCFPIGIENKETALNDNIDFLTDIITAYDDFFSTINESKPVFYPDEYLAELIGLKNKIMDMIDRAKLFNYAETFQHYLEGKGREGAPNTKVDFTLFISIATGILMNGAKRFNALLGNAYFLFREFTAEINDSEVLEDLFKDVFFDYVDLSEKIFADLIAMHPTRKRLSTTVDSEAISRVYAINTELLKRHPGKKILLLFLSSADASRMLFHQVAYLGVTIPTDFAGGSFTFNFHRTVEQLFINRLFHDLSDEEKLLRLHNLYELVYLKEQNEKQPDPEIERRIKAGFEKNITDLLEKLREKYVNVNLARKTQFEKTQKLMDELTAVNKFASYGKLKTFFNKLKDFSDSHGELEENIEQIRNLEDNFKIERISEIIFKKAVNSLLKRDRFVISRGKDKIDATGQHLPIVFRFPAATNEIIDDITKLYLGQIAFYDPRSEDKDKTIVKKLMAISNSFLDYSYSHKKIDETKLTLSLYLLILPEVGLFNKSNNQFVEEYLYEIYDSEYKDFNDKNDLLFADFLYVLSWLFRRNQKYDAALEFAKRGIALFSDDARFYHSRFLINVCRTSTENSAASLVVADIDKALALYPAILASKSELVSRNINAVLVNSKLYAELLILKDAATGSDLEKAKNLQFLRQTLLKELKAIVAGSYSQYPEFVHTEAFLEYLESLFCGVTADKLNKIDSAITILTAAIDTARSLLGYHYESYVNLLDEMNAYRVQLT